MLQTPRVSAVIPATIVFANGRTLACKTRDFSTTGVGLTLPAQARLTIGEKVQIALSRDELEAVLPGTVVSAGISIGVVFDELNITQQRQLGQITFSRADAWVGAWGTAKPDTPLASLRDVVNLGVVNLLRLTLVKTASLPLKLVASIRPARLNKP